MRQTATGRRGGFTLVELLTVIAIIGILISLLLYAISGASSKGIDLQCTNDIRQMSSALDNFKAKYGVYPPSKITLYGDLKNMNAVDLAFIKTVWPRIQPSGMNWSGVAGAGAAAGNVPYPLEGDQCLVFFLAGIPNNAAPGSLGFSSNPLDPTTVGAGATESFYQFDSSRLFNRPTSKSCQLYGDSPPNPRFYSFKDPYSTDQPYVYFSAGRTGYNDASPGDNPVLMPTVKGVAGPYLEGVADPNQKFLLVPLNPLRYVNSTRFQIISAGRDGIFGPGGAWSAAGAGSVAQPGKDDMSNFYEAKLGVPQ